MWAAGVGGPIAGKGFHLGLVDDPIKNAEEANSPVIREKHKDWYRSTFSTREEPGGAIVLIMTRWDEDDLAGWLLAGEEDDGDANEGWHVLHLPAIRDETAILQVPPGCTVEPDWREPGEALCPERYPLDRLRRLKRRVGEYYWFGLYQQLPRSTVGKGRVYYAFDGLNVAEVGDAGGDLLIGMDFNVDPMTAVVASRAGDQLHVFDEIQIHDSGTAEMCREISARYPGRAVTVYPDPSGEARRTSAPVGQTDFALIEAAGFTISAPDAAPPVVDRVNEVNALAEAKRLFVHPGCRNTIAGLEKLTYRPGTNLIKKGRWDHLTDALGYLVHQEFALCAERTVMDLIRELNAANRG
jgi:hypothetical protein